MEEDYFQSVTIFVALEDAAIPVWFVVHDTGFVLKSPVKVIAAVPGPDKYVYGSKSDVLFSEKQVPPSECGKCGAQDLHHRQPNIWERMANRELPNLD